jgi:hypothetical protein
MAPGKKNGTPLRIFVRVGALKRFHTLTRDTAELPVTVSWDRRKSDRRSEGAPGKGERRVADRRGAPPYTWQVADFVVVEEPGDTAPPAAAASTDSAARKQRRRK